MGSAGDRLGSLSQGRFLRRWRGELGLAEPGLGMRFLPGSRKAKGCPGFAGATAGLCEQVGRVRAGPATADT